jgi:hypothetical protein
MSKDKENFRFVVIMELDGSAGDYDVVCVDADQIFDYAKALEEADRRNADYWRSQSRGTWVNRQPPEDIPEHLAADEAGDALRDRIDGPNRKISESEKANRSAMMRCLQFQEGIMRRLRRR